MRCRCGAEVPVGEYAMGFVAKFNLLLRRRGEEPLREAEVARCARCRHEDWQRFMLEQERDRREVLAIVRERSRGVVVDSARMAKAIASHWGDLLERCLGWLNDLSNRREASSQSALEDA